MEVDWNLIAGEVMTQMLRILLPVVIVLIFKWIVEIWTKLLEKNPKLAEAILLAGRIGYAAAEEYFRDLDTTGEDKMEYALARAEEYLHSLGIHVNLDVIHDSIVQYGVTEHKFSWTQKSLEELFGMHPSDEDDPEEEETEGDQ